MKSPRELLDGIIRYIENEREVYGDFSASPGASVSAGDLQNEASSQTEKAEEPAKPSGPDVTRSPSGAGAGSRRPRKDTGSLDPQEGLFEEDPSRDIYYEIGDCNTLEELNALCTKAEVLRTDLADTNLVFGVGNPKADLMLIGEAPGAEEDKQGEPFVGAAGQLLNKILMAIDFRREDVYIANILKHRPPNNRNPLPEERERSLPFLLKQIELIDPKLILCLGKTSAQTLLENNNSLSSMRGTFHTFRGKYELLATYHPAALLRHEKWKRPTWEDVQKLRNRYDELGGKP